MCQNGFIQFRKKAQQDTGIVGRTPAQGPTLTFRKLKLNLDSLKIIIISILLSRPSKIQIPLDDAIRFFPAPPPTIAGCA
jgi:hypothetical protein